MSKEKPLPVIIRWEGAGASFGGTYADWHLNDLIAVFPTEPGDDAHSMSCYSHLGQHSSCVAGYIGAKTRPATAAMVRAMLAELRTVGYTNLKVVSRASSHHARERRALSG